MRPGVGSLSKFFLFATALACAACSPGGPAPSEKGSASKEPPSATSAAVVAQSPSDVPPPPGTGTPPADAPKSDPAPAPVPPSTTPASPPTASSGGAVTSADEAASKWFITIERAKELFDAKEVNGRQVIFIDARTFLEFRDEGHIRGAMHYATAYTRGRPQPKVTNYLPGSAIVIYCHGELCTDSVEVGRYFESLKLDIGPVFVLKAGFPAWKAAYPDLVDKGSEVGFD